MCDGSAGCVGCGCDGSTGFGFARIAPLLLLVLAVLSLLHWGSLHSQALNAWHVKKAVGLPRVLFSALTFHLNWLEAQTGYLPANWDVLWSLSVEEMFYVFFPLVCITFVGNQSPLRRVGWLLLFLLAAVLLVLGPWARSVWITTDIGREKSYLGGMNAIAMGCLAALLCDRLSRSARFAGRWLYAAEAVGWLLIAWMATWPRWAWLHGASPLPGTDGSGRHRVAARNLPGDGRHGVEGISWGRMADGTGSLVRATQL